MNWPTYGAHEWARDKVGSQAEVDLVIQHNGAIYPIEIKAGKTDRLKSLRIFMEEKKCHLGIQTPQKKLQLRNGILTIPYYLLSEIHRLIDEAKKNNT